MNKTSSAAAPSAHAVFTPPAPVQQSTRPMLSKTGQPLESTPITTRTASKAVSVSEASDILKSAIILIHPCQLATALRLPPDYILSVIQGDEDEWCLKTAIEQYSDRLTLNALLEALCEGYLSHHTLAEQLERWIHFEKLNRHLPLKEAISPRQQRELLLTLAPVKSQWEDYFTMMRCRPSELHCIEDNYPTVNVAKVRQEILKKASHQGTLTQATLLDALYLDNKLQADRLKKTWGITTPRPGTDDYLQRIIADPQFTQPATLLCGYILMRYRSNDLISAMLMNYDHHIHCVEGINNFKIFLLAKRQLDGSLGQVFRNLWQNNYCEPSVNYTASPSPEQASYPSRPLQPADLGQLIHNEKQQALKNPRHTALITALSLGVRIDLGNLNSECRIPIAVTCAIWLQVLRQIPLLETGHLRIVMEQLGLHDSLRLVPELAKAEQPQVSLRGLSLHAAEFLEVASWLNQDSNLSGEIFNQDSAFSDETFLNRSHSSNLRLLSALSSRKSLVKQIWPLLDRLSIRLDSSQKTVLTGILDPSTSTPPDDYICPLSLDLMDDPVAVKLTPDDDETRKPLFRYFSKSWLLRAVTDKPENPFTRAPLTRQQVAGLEVDRDHLERIRKWQDQHPPS